MLKLGSNKKIGTPVRCPSCRHPNLAIDIWCERCGTPLDWRKSEGSLEPPPLLHAVSAPRPSLRSARRRPAIRLPRPAKPSWMTGTWSIPRFALPRLAMPRTRLPVIPRIVWVVAVELAVLLIVPLVYILLPSSRPLAGRQPATTQLSATNAGQVKSRSPRAAAIAAVEAKTGLKYSTRCSTTSACLSIAGQTIGKDAAAIVFVTAKSGGRQCVAYVYQKSGAWYLLDAACALPGQVSPLVGHDATVRVSGSCANLRDAASLEARVVTCLGDGATVHVNGGPVYADGFMWWQTDKGWMAHDFLVAP
jgi:hypothetical protein